MITTKGSVEWEFCNLTTTKARLTATFTVPWFIDWFKQVAAGKADCIHCGQVVEIGGRRQAALFGAAKLPDGQKAVVITVCWDCAKVSPSIEVAAQRAVDAAEAIFVSEGRVAKVGGTAPGSESVN